MVPAGLEDFRELSARIGQQLRHVQGAGGNTSIKLDETLWVKASGTWLAEAMRRFIFVPIDLTVIRQRIGADDPDPVTPAFAADERLGGLRPSIETTLHALLPHRVVIHSHSVTAIALAVRSDTQQELARRLDGLSWAYVPYARPGVPLTRLVVDALANHDADVLVLGNHGLVVGADDCDAAERRLADVDARLAATGRPAPSCDIEWLQALATGTSYRLPSDARCHVIAVDPDSFSIATGGSLYPDHVVFLGPGMVTLEPAQSQTALASWTEATGPAVIGIRDAGVLVRRNLPPSAEAMLECLAQVLPRIPASARSAVRYLTPQQEGELLDWDAEKLRQAMNR
jgi:rhamnose utilization protein RhaD (predicted bifunctional aldolase and dehydrogenase)